MLRKILFFATLITSASAFAQTGTIKGTVKDGVSNDGIVGANILIQGGLQGAAADITGNFEIKNVKAGTYNLIVSFISYKTDTLKNITVYPDQTTVVNTSLFEEAQQLENVVVTGTRVTNTNVAVITELKKTDLVAVGISAQQISVSQDRDAAQIIKRIPGVTIQNNRFVNVRGLSERYSIVTLNGVIAPSTEVDSRAFAFDLIPSNMIDRMLVYKSGAAEIPGEFAGAVINIATKTVVDENALSVNFTTGFRAGTTFKDFNSYNGSSTDWLGFDNGTRTLPSAIPSNDLRNYTQNLSDPSNFALVKKAGLSIPNSWETTTQKALPDMRTTINFSHIGHLFGKKLSNVTSLSYANTYQHIQQNNIYYGIFVPAAGKSAEERFNYNDQRDQHTNRTGVISNFILELNPSNKIIFQNLFNQQGMSQVTNRSGVEVGQTEVRNRAFNYLQRGIYSGQLQGKHSISNKLGMDWVLGYSSVNSSQPDYRRIRSQRNLGSTDDFSIIVPPNASAQDGRFYSNLTEKVFTQAANFSLKLGQTEDEDRQKKLLFGYYVAKTERDFSARWFSYHWFRPDVTEQFTNGFQNVFTPERIAPSDGSNPLFVFDEGTNFSDKYTGSNMLTAGYTSLVLPFGEKNRLTTGVRFESNKQQLHSRETNGNALNVNNPVNSMLPFVNLSRNLNEKNLVRVAYSKTVNRPAFRELAPFNFYDFDRNANILGNKDLKVASIHNVDVRFENYPTKSEMISVGFFYKKFINPIEQLNTGGSNLVYGFANAASASNYGVEVEVRKSFENLTNSGFIDNLSVALNGALIKSEVKLDPNDPFLSNQIEKRSLQGQSPYIFNAALFYSDVETGWQVNASYNVFGPRIFAVGDKLTNATQYEMPRHQLDLTISKEFNQHWEVKIGIQDVLNQRYRIIQDSDRDNKITGIDEKIQTFRLGQYISTGVTYRIR